MEQWLMNNLAELILIMIGGMVAFVKVRSTVLKNRESIEQILDALNLHLKDKSPHTTCDLEAARLISLGEKLDRVERKLDVLDNRTIEILKHWRTAEKGGFGG